MSPAELISKLYRLRWMIELFFRTIKSMLHCNHLLMTFNKETETMYRGLSPHKITPMSGVLHAKPDLRVFLKMDDRWFGLGDRKRYHASGRCNLD